MCLGVCLNMCSDIRSHLCVDGCLDMFLDVYVDVQGIYGYRLCICTKLFMRAGFFMHGVCICKGFIDACYE